MNQRCHESWLGAAALAAAILACTGIARAQDLGRLLPEARSDQRSAEVGLGGAGGGGAIEGGGEVLVEVLRGIDLTADPAGTVGGPHGPVSFSRLAVPRARQLQETLARRVGAPLTLAGLAEVADAVVAHYQEHGVPAIEVIVPEQEVTDGRVVLVVVEGRIGDVALLGGEHLNRGRIARAVASATGAPLTIAGLQADLDWLNRNRFHDARLTVAQGEGLAEADLLFHLSDERPFRLFGGFENSGVEVVGEERWLAGFEWGDVFGLGHRAVYQATVGVDVEAFRGHALDYRVPLPWRHELGMRAAIVKSKAELDDGLASGGTSWLLGADYTVPLPRALGGALRHELLAGFDWKSTDNNLEFGGTEVFATAAKIAQFSAAYHATLERPDRITSLLGEFVYSPGGLGDDNSDEAFAGIRADARSEYVFLRGGLRHLQRLPGDAALVVRAGGQWTDTPLLPSEQLALGGHDRVRGYPERDGLGDVGYFGSLELRAPPLTGLATPEGELQFLGFVDYGRAWPQGGRGGASERELASAGPGLRYRFGERASIRLDHAWQLDGGGSRTHIGLRVEF